MRVTRSGASSTVSTSVRLGKSACFCLLFSLLCSILSAQEQSPEAPRFQLFVASFPATAARSATTTLFRIDTATGQVWMFIDQPKPDKSGWIVGWTKVPELPSVPPKDFPYTPPPLQQQEKQQ